MSLSVESFVAACGRRKDDVQHSSIIAPHNCPHVNIQILLVGSPKEFSWVGWMRGSGRFFWCWPFSSESKQIDGWSVQFPIAREERNFHDLDHGQLRNSLAVEFLKWEYFSCTSPIFRQKIERVLGVHFQYRTRCLCTWNIASTLMLAGLCAAAMEIWLLTSSAGTWSLQTDLFVT